MSRRTLPDSIAGATKEYLSRGAALGSGPQSPIRDAASLVIFDDSGDEPRFLMGRRGVGHVFLPDILVFPGGRVEPRDYHLRPRRSFAPATVSKIAARAPDRPPAAVAHALAAAALREAREEAGFVWPGCRPDNAGADLSQLSFIARALTPPKRPRRFDTRFFSLRCRGMAAALQAGDGELQDVGWYALSSRAAHDLHVVSRAVIQTLLHRIARGRLRDPCAPVPFLFARGGSFQRVFL